MIVENAVGGAKDDLENTAAEEEMFSDEDRIIPVTADIEKDETSDNSEHESEDEIDEEPSPLEGTTEEQEDPLPSVGGAGNSATQEQTSAGTNTVATMTAKVQVDGRMLPLDLVSLICYGKYRSKLQGKERCSCFNDITSTRCFVTNNILCIDISTTICNFYMHANTTMTLLCSLFSIGE